MRNLFLIAALITLCQTSYSQNVRFLYTVSNVGNTATVTIKAQAIAGTGNNLTGFTSYLYYDNTKATVTSYDASPITGAPYNWGIANQSYSGFFSEINLSVPITHNGYVFYQNFDQNLLGFNVPSGAPVTLLTITFNVISDNGGEVFLAGTAQVPPMVYVDNNFTGHNVIILGSQIMGLPLELISFTAQPQQKAVSLNWVSQNEADFAGFELQKADDANDVVFEKLAWVAAKGQAGHEQNQYSYTDSEVEAGSTYYYRLKMIDLDGSHQYSHIVIADFDGNMRRYKVTPNPSKGFFQLEYEATSSGTVELQVHNALGQYIATHEWICEEGKNHFMLDLGGQPAGMYYLTINRQDPLPKVMALEVID